MAAMFSGCFGPPNEDKERVATNEMSQPSEMSLKAKDRVAAVRPNQLSLTSRTNGQSTGGSNDTTAANTTSAGIDPDLKSAPAPPSPVPSPKLRPPPPPRPGRSPAKEEGWLSTRLCYEWRLLQKHSPRRPKLSPTLSPQLQTSDKTVAGSPHFLPEGSKATDSSLTPDPVLPVSPVNTAVGQHPSPKVLEAAKDATQPDRGDDHLDPADFPPTLDPSLPASLVTAVGQHPFPKVFKAVKNAVPPDRGHGHLDFGSEGTENTNGTRGDHGCGLSGAQATAQKAVFNQANHVDVDMATTFKIPIKSLPSPLPLSSARPLLPMPLVLTPPARTTSQSHHAGAT